MDFGYTLQGNDDEAYGMTHQAFETDCSTTISHLRASLIELFDAVGVDPSAPQDVARQFGINKTLTWTIARLLDAADPVRALAFVPGVASIDKIADCIGEESALVEIKARVRKAARDVEQMIETHAGDRGTLELILDNAAESEEGLEVSRRLAFRGNSGICGVQAKTRINSCFVAPNPDNPSKIDVALVAGYVGMRRLRPGVEWTIFKPRAWSDEKVAFPQNKWVPLDSTCKVPGLALMSGFSRGALPEFDLEPGAHGRDYVLCRGPVGNSGAFDCFRGEYIRNAVERYNSRDDTGEFGAIISTPCEVVIVDLIYHKDLPEMGNPEAMVFLTALKDGEATPRADHPSRLPIRARVSPLAGSPPAVATHLVPQYTEMARAVASKLEWDLSQFRGVRTELRYPPLNTALIVRFPLPPAPTTER